MPTWDKRILHSEYNGKSIADGFRRRCIAPGRLVGSAEKPSPGRRRRAAYIRYMTGLRMTQPQAQAACSVYPIYDWSADDRASGAAACSLASRLRISAFSLYRSSELALITVMLKRGKRIRQLPARVEAVLVERDRAEGLIGSSLRGLKRFSSLRSSNSVLTFSAIWNILLLSPAESADILESMF